MRPEVMTEAHAIADLMKVRGVSRDIAFAGSMSFAMMCLGADEMDGKSTRAADRENWLELFDRFMEFFDALPRDKK